MNRVAMNVAKEKCTSEGIECYVYDYCCEGCGSMGHLILEVDARRFECPENCGASYVQGHPPEHLAALMCVVCPVYETSKFGH